MSTTSAISPAPHAPESPPPELRFTVWPLRDDGLAAWITQGLALLLAALAAVYSGSFLTAFLLWLCLQLALWRMWTLAALQFDHRGITQTLFGRTRLFPWHRVTKALVRREGVLVLFDDENLPLGAFRGLYLRWLANREAVLAQFEYYVPARVVRAAK